MQGLLTKVDWMAGLIMAHLKSYRRSIYRPHAVGHLYFVFLPSSGRPSGPGL